MVDGQGSGNKVGGAAKAGGIVAGVGVASAAVGIGVGVEVVSQIDEARDVALGELAGQQQSLMSEAESRLNGLADERTASLEALAAELETRYMAALEQHVASVEMKAAESIENVAHRLGDDVLRTVSAGERDLHRIAQQLETEMIELRDRAIAEIESHVTRAAEIAHSQVEMIRSDTESSVSAIRSEMSERLANLEEQARTAEETINSVADSRITEIAAMTGPIRIDESVNSEDNIEVRV